MTDDDRTDDCTDTVRPDRTTTIDRRGFLRSAAAGLAVAVGLPSAAGIGRAAGTEEGIRVEVRELNADYVAVDLAVPEEIVDRTGDPASVAVLGLADRFVFEEDTVSLPEDTDGFAAPVETRTVAHREETVHYVAYFRTPDLDLPETEEVVLGLGLFVESAIPEYYWASCPGHRDY